MCTIHANDALSGLIRIEQLIHEAGIMPVPEVIASTVNVVVYLEKNKFCKAGRCVSEIREVSGYDRRLRQYITTAIESLYGNSENERREFLYELMELN
jgi:type IV secretion system protein VirB11